MNTMNTEKEFYDRYEEYINHSNDRDYIVNGIDSKEWLEFSNTHFNVQNYDFCVTLYFHDLVSLRNSLEEMQKSIHRYNLAKAPRLHAHFEKLVNSFNTKLFVYSKVSGEICRLTANSPNKNNDQTALLHGVTLNVFFKTKLEVDNFKLTLDKLFNIGCKSYLHEMNNSNTSDVISRREMLGIIRENYII